MKKIVLLLFFSLSLFANFFVVDNGVVVEIVNEPHKNVQIVGSNGHILKKHTTLASVNHARHSWYKKRYKKRKVVKSRKGKKYYHKRHIKRKKYTKKRHYKRYRKHRRYKKIKHHNTRLRGHKRRKSRDLIVIRSSKRILEFYKNGKFKKIYKVAVGKDGWRVYGNFWIRKKVKWPDWRPTKRIREENPNLPEVVPGGPKNPLGPRAMYLGYSAVRIHGTNNPKSVGKAVSHGCFRMKNQDVIELFDMVKVGTPVYIK